MNTITNKIKVSVIGFILAMTIMPVAMGSDLTVTKTWGTGETLTAQDLNDSFNEVESAVTDNNTRITNLETTSTNGLAAAKSFQTTSSGLFPQGSEGAIRTLTITTPGAGQVTLTMSGYLRISHALNTTSSVTLWASMGASKFRVLTHNVPRTYPSFDPTIQGFSFTVSFPVSAAGSHDIDISGVSSVNADWGDCGSVVQGCPVVTMQYVPNTLP